MSYAINDLVKQVTTSSGTGDLTLGASLAGYFTFEAMTPDLAHLVYEVHAVDVGGARTGQFETGIGQFWMDGATPKLRRALPLTNSAETAPLPLNFSAGTKHVYITMASAQAKGVKIDNDGQGQVPWLYVRSGGDDDNAGFGPATTEAFATIERAVEVALECFSRASIDVGAGTFGDIFIDPNIGYRCDLTVVGAGRGSTTIGSVYIGGEITLSLFDFSFSHATAVALTVEKGASAKIGVYSVDANTIAFGACPAGHMLARSGGRLTLGDYHISGGCSAGAHIVSETTALLSIGGEQKLDASVSFSGGVMVAKSLSCVTANNTFTLGGYTVSGKRYDVTGNAVIDTAGAGASHFPGSVAGTTATGGQYL